MHLAASAERVRQKGRTCADSELAWDVCVDAREWEDGNSGQLIALSLSLLICKMGTCAGQSEDEMR